MKSPSEEEYKEDATIMAIPLRRKQICYQQSKQNEQLESTICSEENELLIMIIELASRD